MVSGAVARKDQFAVETLVVAAEFYDSASLDCNLHFWRMKLLLGLVTIWCTNGLASYD